MQFDMEWARGELEKRLKPKRFVHSLGVCETARALARRYGVDEERAAIAGLLHDIAKDMSEARLLELVKTLPVQMEAGLLEHIPLLHAPVGAELARKDFGITDDEICSAIALHTMGKPGMTTLEKIIYLADAIEPGRRDVDEIRVKAETDLDGALIMAMQDSMDYALQKGAAIYPLSVEAREFLLDTYNG